MTTVESELTAYRNEAEHDRQTIADARRRVANDPVLAAHADTICYDWDEGMDHWRWVLSAPVSVIVEWANRVEHDEAVQAEYLADEAAEIDARIAPYFDNEAGHDGL